VPPSQLVRLTDRSVFVTERFDRRVTTRGTERVGYASAMSMLEAKDGDTSSYLDIAAVIEERSDRASADLEELWRRMVFSILAGNTDDHLRNHGFLHVTADVWRLSPAFDVNPNPLPGPKHHATSIDGSDSPATLALALAAARDFRLSDDDAERVSKEVVDAVSRWRDVAARVGISPAAVETMAPAFDALDEAP
jgi:serine/threonine-protein kinase HipA